MSRFNELLIATSKQYLLTEEDLGIVPNAGTAIDVAKEQNSSSDNSNKGEHLTPEGKRYLIELAVKALAVDSANLSEQDKAIFNTNVTSKNAEEILQRIREIVEQNS